MLRPRFVSIGDSHLKFGEWQNCSNQRQPAQKNASLVRKDEQPSSLDRPEIENLVFETSQNHVRALAAEELAPLSASPQKQCQRSPLQCECLTRAIGYSTIDYPLKLCPNDFRPGDRQTSCQPCAKTRFVYLLCPSTVHLDDELVE